MSAEKTSTNAILQGLTIVLVLFRRSNSTGTIVSSRCDMSCIGNSTSTIAYNSTGTIVSLRCDMSSIGNSTSTIKSVNNCTGSTTKTMKVV